MRNPVLAFSLAVTSTALCLPAQQWNEAGDAGDLPRTAQIPGSPTLPLPSIAGTFASASDVDMYLIQIADPATFNATTFGGSTLDTQLWLFRADGRGVTFNDDSGGSAQSTITGAFVPYPGLYYLAVSNYNYDARGGGGFLWNNTPFMGERQPDGPNRGEPVDSWSGAFGGTGAYTIALTGCERPRKQIVAPDNHHFSESTTASLGFGSTTWWRNGGGRFQVLYDASHFTSAGFTVGWLDKLLFRGEDGEPNAGGQSWAGVTVQLAVTSVAPGSLTNDFAANLAAASTTSPVGTIPQVTVRRSVGSMPNNYNIELDLFTAFSGFNYNTANGNLLVDITLPTAAVPTATSGAVMAMQDTAGGVAVVRGQGLSTATPAALTGTLSTTPIVIGFGIDGLGGAAPVIPATNESFGSACGGAPSSFYEAFRNGQAFDLHNVRMTPDNVAAPTVYTVTKGTSAFDATKVNAAPNNVTDDSVTSFPLGFTLNFPGGSTSGIGAAANGYIWLSATATTTDFSPSVAEFLGSVTTAVPRLAPFWLDLHCGRNTATSPNSGLHLLVDTSGGPGNAVAYATWLDVGVFNSVSGTGIADHASYDFQVAIFEATGVIEFRYGTMPSHVQNSVTAIVGFTRGRIGGTTPSVDPQSRDLSLELPFSTSIEGATGNMGQLVRATPAAGGAFYGGRAFAGQTLTFDAVGVPAGAGIGAQLLDFAQNVPGLFVPTITAPGCVLSTSLSPTLFQVSLFPPSTVVGTVPLVVPPGIDGFQLVAQYVVLDGLFGGPDLVTSASNAVRVTVGKN